MFLSFAHRPKFTLIRKVVSSIMTVAFLTSLFGNNDELKHHPADFVHPGVQLENQERASILFKNIDKLPDNQKVAFTLHHVEGLSYQEITEVMQTSLSAVESLIHRAKHNLRKSLGQYYAQNRE